jgi:hypothetical protein
LRVDEHLDGLPVRVCNPHLADAESRVLLRLEDPVSLAGSRRENLRSAFAEGPETASPRREAVRPHRRPRSLVIGQAPTHPGLRRCRLDRPTTRVPKSSASSGVYSRARAAAAGRDNR